MPRHSRIRIEVVEELAKQLRFAPRRTTIRQIERAEKLAAEIVPSQTYAEDWVAWRVTGYRRQVPDPAMLIGEALLGDLSAFCERLSEEAGLQASEIGGDLIGLDELCDRWNVSRKSIERYRRKGLIGLRVRNAAGAIVLVFKATTIASFELRNADVLASAAAFVRSGSPPQDLPKEGAAISGTGVLTKRDRMVIWRAYQWGASTGAIAARFSRSRASIHRVVNERRAELLRRLALSGPVSAAFLEPDAAKEILGAPSARQQIVFEPERSLREFVARWRDESAMDGAVEHELARAYCFLRFRAARGIAALPRQSPGSRALDEIETDLRWASMVKRRLMAAQLGLLIRSVEERLGPQSAASAWAAPLLAAGITALSQATDEFDPFRGGRLAAPAGMSLARTLASASRQVQPRGPGLAQPAGAITRAPDWAGAVSAWDTWLGPPRGLRMAAASMPPLAGEVIVARFGLAGAPPRTMADLRASTGVSEARIVRWTVLAHRIARSLRAGDHAGALVV